jgi:hypothetical protein
MDVAPDNVLVAIWQHVDVRTLLRSVRAVCRRFCDSVHSIRNTNVDALWARLLERDFPGFGAVAHRRAAYHERNNTREWWYHELRWRWKNDRHFDAYFLRARGWRDDMFCLLHWVRGSRFAEAPLDVIGTELIRESGGSDRILSCLLPLLAYIAQYRYGKKDVVMVDQYRRPSGVRERPIDDHAAFVAARHLAEAFACDGREAEIAQSNQDGTRLYDGSEFQYVDILTGGFRGIHGDILLVADRDSQLPVLTILNLIIPFGRMGVPVVLCSRDSDAEHVRCVNVASRARCVDPACYTAGTLVRALLPRQ